jgi:hypothetical protein
MSKAFWIVIALIVVTAVGLSIVCARRVARNNLTQVDWQPIAAAATTYVRELRATKSPVPDVVSLSELVRKGYIPTNAIAGFAGAEVTFRLQDRSEISPTDILARAVMPDGKSEVVLLGDGSVQQRNAKK